MSISGFLLLLGYLCVLLCSYYIAHVSLIGKKQIQEEIFILEHQSYSKYFELLLFAGILIPVICFLSCLIFAVNSLFFFCLYGGMMIVFIILQVLIFFFLHPSIENLKTAFENKVMFIIENAGDSFALQSLQEKYNCCGFDAFTDWLKKDEKIPGSCCKKKFHNTCPLESVHNVSGCRRIIHKYIEQTATYLPYVFSLIFILEVILLASSVSVVINFESSESKKFPRMTNETPDSLAEGNIHFEESIDTHS